MYKGTYNDKGDYTGFYLEGIHENIPEPNIELTNEQWQEALSKNYKVIDGVHSYIPFLESQEHLLKATRIIRNNLLKESDWTQVEDTPLSEDKKTAWKKYRKTLRDITTTDDLKEIIWPERPL